VGADIALPVEFGPERHVIWKTPLPPGHSSPVLSGAHVFVTAFARDELLTIAIDRASGRVAWQAAAPRIRQQRVDARNSPASPTPATDGENVFVFFQDFGLISYDARGRERWRLPLGPFSNAYGMGASPMIVGELVVLVCDQSIGSFMVAVGKDDGRVRWNVDRPDATSGHSTPVVFEPAVGPRQLLVPGSFYLSAYDVDTGRKLWWTGGLAFEMKATPVHDGSVVYINGTSSSSFQDSYAGNIPSFEAVRAADRNGDGRFSRDEVPDQLAQKWMRLLDLDSDGTLDEAEWVRYRAARRNAGGMWAFRMGGTGDTTGKSTVWHYDKSVPQLPSPLLYRNVLYMVNDGGILTAFEPATGRVLAQQRLREAVDSYYASPVGADGKVFVVSESGRVSVLAADGTLTVLAVNDLDDLCYATPAIANGRIYIRTRAALYSFGLR
jgi:outer membrane protein assembly factor BamB